MCESAAYILKEDGMERIMDNVVSVDPFEGKVYLTDLLGEQKIVDGEIKEIRLMDHKIIIKEKKNRQYPNLQIFFKNLKNLFLSALSSIFLYNIRDRYNKKRNLNPKDDLTNIQQMKRKVSIIKSIFFILYLFIFLLYFIMEIQNKTRGIP